MPFSIVRQNITEMKVDAIVNSTDVHFSASGGVDLMIRRAGGEALTEALMKIGSAEEGKPVSTPGFGIPVKNIIHTVAPPWLDGGSEERLRACYHSSLLLAEQLGCESVAIPLLSSGRRRCPKEIALRVASSAIRDFLEEREMEVYLVVYDPDAYRLSRKLVEQVISYIDDNYSGKPEIRDRVAEEYQLDESFLSFEPLDSIDLSLDFDSTPPSRTRRRDASDEGRGCKSFVAAPKEGEFFACYRKITAVSRKGGRRSLEEMIRNMDDSFSVALMKLIDAKGMNDVECYKNANISRQTWYKIQSEKGYRPSKQTVLCFAISLRLTLSETEALLRTAGLALSSSQLFDTIVRYFIEEGIYDIIEINNTLFSFDQCLLC